MLLPTPPKNQRANEANVTVVGKQKPPELPDFSGHFGDRRIASLLRPQKGDFASLVRKIFETRGRFEKSNFFSLYLLQLRLFFRIE